MRIIITGGTGLIGHALAADLGGSGHEVVILSRNPRQAAPLPASVSFVQWDGKTAQGWGHFADGADAIVNLAGASISGEGFFPSKWTDESKKLILGSRVNAGQAVVEAVRQTTNKPKAVIQASAVGYYGVHQDENITEASPAGSDFLAHTCKEWEGSTAAVETLGVRRAVIRTGIVLSTQGGALPRMALPFKLFAGGPLGSGRQQLPWIHINDAVAAIRFLIENPQTSGVFNLSAPNPVTNAQFAKALGRALGRPSFMPTPGFLFKLMFGEVATLVLDGQRALPKRLLELGFQFRFTEGEAALRDLYQRNL